MRSQGSAQTLSLEDAQAISANISEVTGAAPEFRIPVQVSGNGQNTTAPVLGVTADYAQVLNLTVASGQFITQDDVDRKTRTVVLGASVAQTLFGDSDPTGQQIRFGFGRNLITVNVIGVMAKKGGTSTASQDTSIFTPITTAESQIQVQRNARNATLVSQITVQASSKSQIPRAKADITELLLQRHQVADPDFTVESQEDLSAAADQVSQTMTVLLGSIAGISLVVGGIGIMNIMLVSVTERTREIGIRKAVGARRADIMMQFLTEALAVTVAGRADRHRNGHRRGPVPGRTQHRRPWFERADGDLVEFGGCRLLCVGGDRHLLRNVPGVEGGAYEPDPGAQI